MTVKQSDFKAAIFDAGLPVPDGLCNPDGAPAQKRFSVYRNNVAVSLSEALEATFPVIRALVGDEFFKAMAGVFLRQHAPDSPVLMHYGADMPAFLEGFQPVEHLGYLPDVARVELALTRSYHAADTPAIDPEQLQKVAEDSLLASRLHLAPAVRLIRSKWPVAALYHANSTPNAASPVMQPEDVLITRPEFDPTVIALPAGGGAFVEALMTGVSLEEALKTATLSASDFDFATVLGLLLAGGAITEISEK